MVTIQYYKRFAYGRDDAFPTREHAEAIKILTGKKTLSKDHIDALVSLGHTVTEVVEPPRQ